MRLTLMADWLMSASSSRFWWVAVAAMVGLAAGCSSSSKTVTRLGPSTTPPSVTSTAATSPATTALPAATQTVTVTPDSGLKPTQAVLVRAVGFSPGEALVVTECAAKGAATGPGDCDLANMQSVTSDANGELTMQLTVSKGPFGANNIICGPSQACLVSVTQATLSPTQEADARISFA